MLVIGAAGGIHAVTGGGTGAYDGAGGYRKSGIRAKVR